MQDSAPFDDLVWKALHTVHARFAVREGAAVRYPAEVTPFAAVAANTREALSDLARLMTAGEHVYVLGERPAVPEWMTVGTALATEQRMGPAEIAQETQHDGSELQRLRPEDGAAMVALTDLAFPGFFRPRTPEMGTYYGINVGGELVAMAGERLLIPGYSEVSGVVTHPAFTGKGYARRLTKHLMREHARGGVKSFLHVGAGNARARALYDLLGFRVVSTANLWPVSLRG